MIRCLEWGEKNVSSALEMSLDDIELNKEENNVTSIILEDADFYEGNTTETPETISIQICVNLTEDKSQAKELQFVRNIVFWNKYWF